MGAFVYQRRCSLLWADRSILEHTRRNSQDESRHRMEDTPSRGILLTVLCAYNLIISPRALPVPSSTYSKPILHVGWRRRSVALPGLKSNCPLTSSFQGM